jgi:hypothetical protein
LQVKLSFQFSGLNSNTDMIYVTFPAELAILNTSASYAITMASVAVSPALSIFTGNNTVAFNVSSLSHYQIAVTLTATGLAKPRECKTTSNFAIKTYRSNLYLMDSSTCCSLQLANRQTLTINITLSNALQSATAAYTFTLTTSVVNLVPTDGIQIIYPPDYSTVISAANAATLCPGLTITGNNFPALVKTPACSMAMNSLVISSFLTGSLAGSEQFTIVLPGVTNPSSTPTTGFSISTISAGGYVLEQALNFGITIQANVLTAFSVSAVP